jgi:hypothetical protein
MKKKFEPLIVCRPPEGEKFLEKIDGIVKDNPQVFRNRNSFLIAAIRRFINKYLKEGK